MRDNATAGWHFTGADGTFRLDTPHRTSYLYFPLVNEAGMMSAVTPTLHGDRSQNSPDPAGSMEIRTTRAGTQPVNIADTAPSPRATAPQAAQTFAADLTTVSLEAGCCGTRSRMQCAAGPG